MRQTRSIQGPLCFFCSRRIVMRKSIYQQLGLCLALIFGIFSARVSAQTPPALVIEGGTLMDGNGGTPVRDAVIVIQGNKIASVSRKGQAPYPPNAKIIKADGKFILPGLFDSQVS